MAIALTEDHVELYRVARKLLDAAGGTAGARAALDGDGTAETLVAIADVGWAGLALPEDHGGQGYGLMELAIVVEALGRVLGPGTFISTAVAAAGICAAGNEEQRRRWLPGIAEGTRTLGFALVSRVVLDRERVHGSIGATIGTGHGVALEVDDDLVIVDATPVVSPRALDRTLIGGSVDGEVHDVIDTVVGGAAAARHTLHVLAASDATGAMAAITEGAVRYADQREQFGRPIGSFQAIKHHCADLLIATEVAVASTWDAARTAVDADGLYAAVSAAAIALPAYLDAAQRNIQIHGGIGYTWEHDAHLFLRRAAAWTAPLGPADLLNREVIARHRRGARRQITLDVEADIDRTALAVFAAEHDGLPEAERQQHFARSGYLLPHLPSPFGLGAGPAEQLVIDEELAGLERPNLGIGEWVIPTVLQNGSPEQIERWIWAGLEGTSKWCQMFSEPGAGSDAAAITTRAERVDGGWKVTGQKVWTSQAHECDRGLATVRTDSSGTKHAGITAMVIDLQAPGVDIRPLREITGEALFNEIFLDDVFVPDADVLGEVGNGWRVARATLGNERVSIAGGSVTITADELVALADDRGMDDAVGGALAEWGAVRMLNLRHAARALHGTEPGLEGTLAKLYGAEHAQRVANVALALIGPTALGDDGAAVMHDYLFSRCLTIAGGTSEVLRNQIVERILGLPREPTT